MTSKRPAGDQIDCEASPKRRRHYQEPSPESDVQPGPSRLSASQSEARRTPSNSPSSEPSLSEILRELASTRRRTERLEETVARLEYDNTLQRVKIEAQQVKIEALEETVHQHEIKIEALTLRLNKHAKIVHDLASKMLLLNTAEARKKALEYIRRQHEEESDQNIWAWYRAKKRDIERGSRD